MGKDAMRVVRRGLTPQQPQRTLPVVLVCIMLAALMQPASADLSVSRDDFGVLDELATTLEDRADAGEALVALQGAESSFAMLDAAKRSVTTGDALADAEGYLDNVELRDTTPMEEEHPRPYVFLTDVATHPDAWPYNLWETLFSVESLGLDNLLGFGINTYAVYVNFTARNNGPSYEAWDSGTFTGELLVGTDLVSVSYTHLTLPTKA